MSELLGAPADDDEDSSRSRAVWGLVALAIIAGLIVVVMIATSGSGGQHGSHSPGGLSQLPSEPTGSTTAPTQTSVGSSTRSSVASATATTSAVPTSTANPCGAAKSCAVPGDAGQLIPAVNRFRTGHGRPPVSGTVTAQAQQCATAQGDGPACAPSYSWEPVSIQDGPKAVELAAGRGGGTQWLLDPTMTSFQVGWAYANGQFECAILKVH